MRFATLFKKLPISRLLNRRPRHRDGDLGVHGASDARGIRAIDVPGNRSRVQDTAPLPSLCKQAQAARRQLVAVDCSKRAVRSTANQR